MTSNPHPVAIVTGAARGIGEDTANLLQERGYSVVGVDQRFATGRTGPSRYGWMQVTADVSSQEQCARAVDVAIEQFGRLDVLVNNAAIGLYGRTVENTTLEEWDHVLAVNLRSVFLMSKYAVPAIRRAGGGCIVNVSSFHALSTDQGVAAYAASKGGVLALTRNMALDFARDRIRAVAVLPGGVDTPLLSEAAAPTGQAVTDWFTDDDRKTGRLGQPREISEVIAFLASPAASFINGTGVLADGGRLASF